VGPGVALKGTPPAGSKGSSPQCQPATPLAPQNGSGNKTSSTSTARVSGGVLSREQAQHGELTISQLLAMAPQRKRPLAECMAASEHPCAPPRQTAGSRGKPDERAKTR